MKIKKHFLAFWNSKEASILAILIFPNPKPKTIS
jgi:hypothetical protein